MRKSAAQAQRTPEHGRRLQLPLRTVSVPVKHQMYCARLHWCLTSPSQLYYSSQKMKTTKVQECKQDGTLSSWVCSRAHSRIGKQKTPQAMRNGWHDVVLCLTCLYDTVSPVELLHIAVPFFELSREVCCCTCCRSEASKLSCSFNCNGSVPPAVSASCINERAL